MGVSAVFRKITFFDFGGKFCCKNDEETPNAVPGAPTALPGTQYCSKRSNLDRAESHLDPRHAVSAALHHFFTKTRLFRSRTSLWCRFLEVCFFVVLEMDLGTERGQNSAELGSGRRQGAGRWKELHRWILNLWTGFIRNFQHGRTGDGRIENACGATPAVPKCFSPLGG